MEEEEQEEEQVESDLSVYITTNLSETVAQ